MHAPLPIIVQKSSLQDLKAFGGLMGAVNHFTPNQKQFVLHDEILLYSKCVKLRRQTLIHSVELLRSLFNRRRNCKVETIAAKLSALQNSFFPFRQHQDALFGKLLWFLDLQQQKNYWTKLNEKSKYMTLSKLWWVIMTFEEIYNLPFNGYKPLQVARLLNLRSAFLEASAKNPLGWSEQYWPTPFRVWHTPRGVWCIQRHIYMEVLLKKINFDY